MFEFSRCDVLPVDRRGGFPGGVPHLPGRVRPAHQQQRDDLLREHLGETRHLGRLPAPALSRDEVSEVVAPLLTVFEDDQVGRLDPGAGPPVSLRGQVEAEERLDGSDVLQLNETHSAIREGPGC